MKIWIVHQHAGVPEHYGYSRHYYFAKELLAQGHDVTVVASQFNHKAKKPVPLDQEGTIIDTRHDGVRFIWIKGPTYNESFVKRLFNLAHFYQGVLGSWQWRKEEKPDVIVGSSPSPIAALGAARIAKKLKVPFVLEVRDFYPLTLTKIGKLPGFHPIVLFSALLQQILYRSAKHFITVVPSGGAQLAEVVKNPPPVTFIPHSIPRINAPSAKKPWQERGDFRVLYTGSHGLADDLENIIDAFNDLDKMGADPRIKLELIGDGALKEDLIAYTKGLGLLDRRVFFKDPIPQQEVLPLLRGADCLILSRHDSKILDYGISLNKIPEYMASGAPTIMGVTTKDDPVTKSNCGIVVPRGENSLGLAKAILKISEFPQEERDAMGQRGWAYCDEYLSHETLAQKFLSACADAADMETKRAPLAYTKAPMSK